MRGLRAVFLSGLVVFSFAPAAPAAVTLTAESRWAETRALFSPGNSSNLIAKTEKTDGKDFTFVQGGGSSFSGYNLDNRANASTQFTPTDVGLNASFSKFTIPILDVRAGFTNASNTETYSERRSRGHFNAVLLFTLDGPADWTFSGERSGSTSGVGTINFDVVIRNRTTTVDALAYRKSAAFFDNGTLSGQLPAGDYFFSFQALADVHLPDNGTGQSILQSYENVFTLTPVPEPTGLAAIALAVGALCRRRR